MTQDTTSGIRAEGNHSSTSISNPTQDDETQHHGDAYGHPTAFHPGNDNDTAPLVTSQTNTDGYEALSRLSRLLTVDLLITLVVAVFIAVVIIIYQRKGNMTGNQKHAFNTIITGLIVGLGLSFFVSGFNQWPLLSSNRSPACVLKEAFKSLAKRYGVWVLSKQQGRWNSKEQSLIRGSDSLMNVFTLGVSNLRSLTAVLCFAWVWLPLSSFIRIVFDFWLGHLIADKEMGYEAYGFREFGLY